jgi:hypothetical protein
VSMANMDEGGGQHTPSRGEETKGSVSTANMDEERRKHALPVDRKRWV